MENNRSNSQFNPSSNFMRTTSLDYGDNWLVNDAKSLQELGENAVKLKYLEKSLKSKRRIEQRNMQKSNEPNQEETVFSKNEIVPRKFPFKADEFKYPNDGQTQHNSLFIKYSQEYGSKKPNDLELPGMIFYLMF